MLYMRSIEGRMSPRLRRNAWLGVVSFQETRIYLWSDVTVGDDVFEEVHRLSIRYLYHLRSSSDHEGNIS